MSCALKLIEDEIYRISAGIEQKLDSLSTQDKQSHEWAVTVFYTFAKNEHFEVSDKYTIKIAYKENEDSKQQNFKFARDSPTTIFFNRLCNALYMYITKSYLVEGMTGNEDVLLRYEKMPSKELTLEDICEVCTAVFAIPIEIEEIK